MQSSLSTRRRPLLITTVLVIAATFLGAASCAPGSGGPPDSLTVALPPLEQSALIYVAAEKGYFARHGLNVVVVDYRSGAAALDALQKGDADVAEAAEYPFARLALQREPLYLIASNDKYENDYVVARGDRGIQTLADLKGKRVGVARRTIAEFHLGRLLELHGIRMRDITLVDVKPDHFVSVIAGGEVDAILAWQPYVTQIQKEIGGLIVWPAQSGQAAFSVLVCRSQWVAGHGGTVQRFIESLKEAEDYVTYHPDGAKVSVQKRLKYDSAYVADIWPQHRFSLRLDQSLIMAMEDEGAWMIREGLTGAKELPDFNGYIYTRALEATKPGAVSIVR